MSISKVTRLENETEAINYNKIVINTNIWILTIINYILHFGFKVRKEK